MDRQPSDREPRLRGDGGYDIVLRERGRRRGSACYRDRAIETVQALNHGTPFGEIAVNGDEKRKRGLHAAKRARGLHQAAELHGASEIGRADDDKGKYECEAIVGRSEEGQPLLP